MARTSGGINAGWETQFSEVGRRGQAVIGPIADGIADGNYRVEVAFFNFAPGPLATRARLQYIDGSSQAGDLACPRCTSTSRCRGRIFLEGFRTMAVTTESMLAWCEILLGCSRATLDKPWPIIWPPSLVSPRWPICPPARRCWSAATSTPSRAPRSARETFACARWSGRLQFGRNHGWKQIIFGHIGRKPEQSL